MGAEDVGAFLASVGSPLASGGEAQKQLPSSAVLQLLSTRIEALAASEEPEDDTEPQDDTADDELDEDLVRALETYAYATAHYTHTSTVSSIIEQLTAAIKSVADVQLALDARDWNRMPALLPSAQSALHAVGIEIDFLHNYLNDAPEGPMAHSATVARLMELCRDLLEQMHTQVDEDWKHAVQVIKTSQSIVLAVQESKEDPESTNIPNLLDLWEFAQSMNLGETVAERISTSLVDKLINPLLGDVKGWDASESTTTDDILTQLVFSASSSDAHETTAIPVLVQMLAFLRKVLFIPSAQDGPAVQDALLAPSLQVLVSHYFVPRLIELLKPYLLRCLPDTQGSLHDFTAATETATRLAMQVHHALVEYGYVRETSAAGSMVRRPGWAPIESLSDLRQWTEHLAGPCSQHVLGGVLDHIRSLIARTDDKAWDTVSVKQQVEELQVAKPRSPPKSPVRPDTKPEQRQRIPRSPGQEKRELDKGSAPTSTPSRPPPLASEKSTPETGAKPKKPTLGKVKKLGAVPMPASPATPDPKPASIPKAVPPAVSTSPIPEPQDDDWGWGDEDDFEQGGGQPPKPSMDEEEDAWDMGDAWDQDATIASKQSEEKPEPAPQQSEENDEWGWGSDEEVEGMLGETQAQPASSAPSEPKPTPPQIRTEMPPADAPALSEPNEDDALDAWDWNEPDEESPLPQENPLPPASLPPPSPEATSVVTRSRMISQRCLAVAEGAKQQFDLLNYTSEPRLLHSIAQAVLECFQMYRALMPVVHLASLQHVPLLSMLFANDCDYLADEMRVMTQAKTLPEPLRNGIHPLPVALQCEAEALQDVGTQWREAQLALQSNALQECLDQADGFARTDQEARNIACERAVSQVDHILQHLVTVWAPVLSHDMLIPLMGELVQAVFVRVQGDIEELEDISEPESMRLAALCRTLLEAQSALFAQAAHCDAESAGALAATAVPSWFKFSYLPELLTGSLADIEYLLFDSGGALLDYAREEIVALIRALFADTHHRRRLLERVQRAPWTSAQTGFA